MGKTLKNIRAKLKLDMALVKELYKYFRIIRRHNGSGDTMSSPGKLKALIMRESHVLEKGMSMPNPHFPFGKDRAMGLIAIIKAYLEIPGHDTDIASHAVDILFKYISLHSSNGVALDEIGRQASMLANKVSATGDDACGTIDVNRNTIREEAKKDFEHLMKSRHSYRSFSDEEVPYSIVEEALRISSMTPSACNRQAWRTHVYQGAEASDILTWQEGCRGFADKIRNIIVVTADLNAFFAHEIFQAYVDGGLYAMNLINSLHFLGVGTIPLSCGFSQDKLEQLHKFGIPDNEVPIVIIGLGIIPERTSVAASQRIPFTKTNTLHE